MSKNRVRHLPVVADGILAGVLSERDLYLLESIRAVDIEQAVVEDAMSTDVHAVASSTPLTQVARTWRGGDTAAPSSSRTRR